jgi:ATP-dependent DNA helicase RecQ
MSGPLYILRSVFGYDSFLGQQQAIIETVLAGRDAVVLMPTGAGKSLCYQVPALIRPGTAVVVSPLIALMRDQVQGLTQNGVRAACLNSSLTPAQARDVEAGLAAGRLDLLYVAPERLFMPGFLERLARIPVALFAIDEAHCVSQWGHDFRPEYTRLGELAGLFPGVPRLALTATADDMTRADIIRQLRLDSARVFASGFDRPNIRYLVTLKDRPEQQLLAFLRSRPPGEAGIVYRMSRKKVEATAQALSKEGFTALPYHAGLSAAAREAGQERFMREEGVVMVATVAFGMGVDKPNVRFVAHLDPPTSLEAYHQETGRAGRDGLPAVAWMTYGLADIAMLRRLVAMDDAQAAGLHGDGEARKRHERLKQHKLTSLLGYCETAGCRRQALLRYFGQDLPEPCGNCDTCLHPVETWDGTVAAQKALSNIFRVREGFGAGHLADVLAGKATAAVERWGHAALSTFGVGTELSRAEWLSVYRQLVAAGLADVDLEGYGALKLNSRSWDVMKGRQNVSLRRDPQPVRGGLRAKAPAPGAFAKDTGNADDGALWESLRALRLEISREQGVPPYAVFADRTLMDMVRLRPRLVEELLSVSGVGRMKLAAYGERFVEVLRRHEDEFGRPQELPPLPAPRAEKVRLQADALSATEQASVDAFAQAGSVREAAAARGLKPATVFAHLIKAVALGRLGAAEVAGLTRAQLSRIEEIMDSVRVRGQAGLAVAHEALGGEFDFDVLRCVRAGMRRARTEG